MPVAKPKTTLKTVSNVGKDTRKGEGAQIENKVEIGQALAVLLSDVFTLYIKTKNFHWHVSGTHFRDYHLMLDEQAVQLLAITDLIAERARKLGQPTIRSVEQMIQLKRLSSSDVEDVKPEQMLAELHADNEALAAYMRTTHDLTGDSNDISTTSLLEEWVDEAEQRCWFLSQTLAV